MDKASAPAVTPTAGRIVHFVLGDGQVRPAMIVRVWSATLVQLQVFLDGTNDTQPTQRGDHTLAAIDNLTTTGVSQVCDPRGWATSVSYAAPVEVGMLEPRTWFWPPREPVAGVDPRGGAA
ncbi:MAG: hypothetical protein JWN27_2876 [Candidatus Eremiobacteraeota bacterium]|nr:hypothetical protein [Candidatus Eremiobacteraeota bacterium]